MPMDENKTSIPLIAVTAAFGAIVILIALLCVKFYNAFSGKNKSKEGGSQTRGKGGDHSVGKKKKQSSTKVNNRRSTQNVFSHDWLSCCLKGHSSTIVSLDFSPNGKYLLSASDDRALMIWSVKEFEQKDHKYIRGNAGLDSATHLAFSPDSRAFIASLENENALRIFRLGKKDGSQNVSISPSITFPKKHEAEIINIGIDTKGRYIMSCGSDTTIILWDLKGEVLHTINTQMSSNTCGKVSPCGKFVVASGFTPDVKAWEVHFDKSGAFKEVKRAFTLMGHNASVYSFDFNSDSTRMVSVSKDNTWKFWNTDVRYEMNQDPKLLYTCAVDIQSPAIICLSLDCLTVAVGSDTTVHVFNAVTSKKEMTFEDVHSDSMTTLGFDHSGKYLVSSGGRHIQVLHNIVGYRAAITDMHSKLGKATSSSMKDRIKKQIADAQETLKRVTAQHNGKSKSE